MLCDWAERSKKLIGEEGILKLSQKTVVVLGLGGVGGSCAEALCRAGIGKLILVDSDSFELTNLNRQVLATREVLNMKKCDVAKRRFESINPDVEIIIYTEFCLPSNSEFIFSLKPDYIADCIDTITTKIFFAIECNKRNVNLVSCLGMGNRHHPENIRLGDIKETIGSGCAISKIVRQKLKANGIFNLDVVYSTEKPVKGLDPPGSVSFVPPVAGYFAASKIINNLLL